jgi:carbon storage regulator
MLVLSRKPGEKIQVGDHITITVVRIGPNTVRLGISAPKDLKVVRDELIKAIGGDVVAANSQPGDHVEVVLEAVTDEKESP